MHPINTIPGYEPFIGYFVTEEGEIYSEKTEKFLKQQFRSGYKRINLCAAGGVRKSFSVHRLVALAFHYFDGCEKLTVNHIDENPANNHRDNLEWLTMADNIRYTHAKSRTFDNPDEILDDWNTSTMSLKEFSNKYNVAMNTMWDTLNISAKGDNLRKRRKFDKAERLLIAKERAKGTSLSLVAEKFKCSESMVSKVYGEYTRGELNDLS